MNTTTGEHGGRAYTTYFGWHSNRYCHYSTVEHGGPAYTTLWHNNHGATNCYSLWAMLRVSTGPKLEYLHHFQHNKVISHNVHILASIHRSPSLSRTRKLPPKGIELYSRSNSTCTWYPITVIAHFWFTSATRTSYLQMRERLLIVAIYTRLPTHPEISR